MTLKAVADAIDAAAAKRSKPARLEVAPCGCGYPGEVRRPYVRTWQTRESPAMAEVVCPACGRKGPAREGEDRDAAMRAAAEAWAK